MSDPLEGWEHFNPVRVVAGPGAVQRVPELVPAQGTVVLVTTPGFTRRGLTGRLTSMLEGAAIKEVLVHDQVTPNPQLDDLDATIAALRPACPSAVLAVGGGSALDTGKVLAATLSCPHPRPLHRVFREGEAPAGRQRLRMIAVPTTAGTGSEATPFATIWDARTSRKFSLDGEHVFPFACVLDPELTLTLGHEDTLFPGLDTVSHALESLWNRRSTPFSCALALHALRLATEHLPRVLANGNDLIARAGMQQSSVLAAQAIARTRTAIAHSISYPLTLEHGVPHGLACSFTLPGLLRLHGAELFSGLGDPTLPTQLLKLLDELQLPTRLGQFATPSEVRALLPRMHTPGRAENFVFPTSAAAILEAALEGPPP